MKGRDHWEDLGVDGRIVLEQVLEKQGLDVWTGFTWLRTGTNDGLLWTQ
jgi:hypothetical protein